jgi:hypothetical protein
MAQPSGSYSMGNRTAHYLTQRPELAELPNPSRIRQRIVTSWNMIAAKYPECVTDH